MAVQTYQVLQEKVDNCDIEAIYRRICANIKRIRKERYDEFKRTYKNATINPYSTENMAALLEYNHNHYKRFESENDSVKKIPLRKLFMISLILDVTIEELLK